jgi:hypothetical protein
VKGPREWVDACLVKNLVQHVKLVSLISALVAHLESSNSSLVVSVSPDAHSVLRPTWRSKNALDAFKDVKNVT